MANFTYVWEFHTHTNLLKRNDFCLKTAHANKLFSNLPISGKILCIKKLKTENG